MICYITFMIYRHSLSILKMKKYLNTIQIPYFYLNKKPLYLFSKNDKIPAGEQYHNYNVQLNGKNSK